MSGSIEDELSPAPILAAVEAASGSLVDLGREHVVTADELRRTISTLAETFRGGGIARGKRVAMVVGNGPMFVATLTAILACEASPLLVHSKTPPATN